MKRTACIRLAVVLGQVAHLLATGLTRETQAQLASSSSGRVILHVACACHDHKVGWHWRGLLREFGRN